MHRLADAGEQHRRQELHAELVHLHRFFGHVERVSRQRLEDDDGQRAVERRRRRACDLQALAGRLGPSLGGRLRRRRRSRRIAGTGGAGRDAGEERRRGASTRNAAHGPDGALATAHADTPAPNYTDTSGGSVAARGRRRGRAALPERVHGPFPRPRTPARAAARMLPVQ
ncbi:MAG: hypothetical protein F4137_17980 [Acidobacteria bacterium]|nr:hypothetical protein [Acidobacteriota bacterium]